MRALRPIRERDIAHLLDGVRYALFGASSAFNHLRSSCRELESREPNDIEVAEVLEILNSCWQVIDQTYRAEQMFARLAPLRIKGAGTQEFHKNASKAAKFRSLYHHLGRHSDSISTDEPPAIGALSWIKRDDPMTSMSLALHSGSVQFSAPGLIFDTHRQKFIEDFVFSAVDRQISLIDLKMGGMALSAQLEAWLEVAGISTDKSVAPVLLAISFGAKSRLQT